MRPIVVHWLEQFMRADLAELLAPTWFMCVGIAGLVSLGLMLALARRRGVESGTVASVVFWGYLAAVLAGIVVPMTIDAIQHLFATGHVQLRWAGMTSFWGYLAGAAAIAIVCKRDRVPLARVADLIAIPMGAALVFARLGCFMAGCDYGKVSALPWAMRFPAGSPAWRDEIHAGLIPSGRLETLAVHPTQLYEALLGLVIIAVAWFVARRTRTEGRVFLAAATTYAVGRLLIETLRGDIGRGIYGGLSSGQIFSLLVLLAIAARFALTKRLIPVATLVLLAGTARAQPSDPPPTPVETDTQSDTPPPVEANEPAPVFGEPEPIPPIPPSPELRRLRPLYAVGLLLTGATSVNRPGEQVPDLGGGTLSFGFIPGRFGLWVDVDWLKNSEASHDGAVMSVSFIPRVTPHLWIGARAGIGATRVNFMNDAFTDVLASDVRLDAVAELVMNHNWVVWVRPLTIDVISAEELGGPITTFQFRAGVAYRFGERAR
ncbi:MAG: prolipoprotein diacylglyceryl transferase family protein [Kofleriaceae bacterium]